MTHDVKIVKRTIKLMEINGLPSYREFFVLEERNHTDQNRTMTQWLRKNHPITDSWGVNTQQEWQRVHIFDRPRLIVSADLMRLWYLSHGHPLPDFL